MPHTKHDDEDAKFEAQVRALAAQADRVIAKSRKPADVQVAAAIAVVEKFITRVGTTLGCEAADNLRENIVEMLDEHPSLQICETCREAMAARRAADAADGEIRH